MSSDGMFLGSEVIIMSVEDARWLVMALLKPYKIKELQEIGILSILEDLRSAVKRHDIEVDDA